MDYEKIIQAFGVLNRTFSSYMTKPLADLEISYSDSIFLVNIGEKEGITQEEISLILAIDKAAIARSIKSMAEKGYIKKIQSEEDKRANKLYLTERGRQLYESLLQVNHRWVEYLFEGSNKDEIQIFEDVVNKISKRAKEYK